MINTNIDKSFFPHPIIRAISGLFDILIAYIIIIIILTFIKEIFFTEFVLTSMKAEPSGQLYLIYILIIPYLTNGQTLGQYIFRLKTVSLLSHNLSFIQIIARQSISWFGLNGAIKKNNQQIHDRLLQTTVIKQSKYNEFKLLNIKEKLTLRYKILSIILFILISIIFINDIRILYTAWL